MPPWARTIASVARLELGEVALRRVLDEQAVEAAVVGLAHRRLHAHLGRDAGEQQMRDAALAQVRRQGGGVERALAGLVDDDLAGQRAQLGDDVVARLAARSGCGPSARHRRCAAPGCRAGAWPAGSPTGRARGTRGCGSTGTPASRTAVEQALRRRARSPASRRDVVAQGRAEAAGLEEVALHVDDDQRRVGARKGEGRGQGGDGRHGQKSFSRPRR